MSDQNLHLYLWKEESMHHTVYEKQLIILTIQFLSSDHQAASLSVHKSVADPDKTLMTQKPGKVWHFLQKKLKLRGIAPWICGNSMKKLKSKAFLFKTSICYQTSLSISFLIHFWSLQFLMSSRHCRALTQSILDMQSRCPSTKYLDVEYFQSWDLSRPSQPVVV